MRVDKTISELHHLTINGDVVEVSQMAINTIKKLQEELMEWESGQRQTVQDYNAYRDRGVQLYEKGQKIKELTEENERMKRIIKSNAFVIDENI